MDSDIALCLEGRLRPTMQIRPSSLTSRTFSYFEMSQILVNLDRSILASFQHPCPATVAAGKPARRIFWNIRPTVSRCANSKLPPLRPMQLFFKTRSERPLEVQVFLTFN